MERVTDKPFVNLKRNADKSDQIYNLVYQDKFKDLEFICGPQYESVKAHSLILSTYSPMIEQMYQAQKKLGPNLKIILRDTNKTIVGYVLKLVYEGNVDVPKEDLPNLYSVCDQLQMRDIVLDNPGESEVILSNSEQACDNNEEEEEVTVSSSEIIEMDVPQLPIPSDTDKDTRKTRKLYDCETAAVTELIVEPPSKRLSPQPSTSKDTDSPLRFNPFAEQIRSKVVRMKKSDKKKTVSETNLEKNSSSLSKNRKHDSDTIVCEKNKNRHDSDKNTETAPNCSQTGRDKDIITIETDSDSTDSDLMVQQPVKKVRTLDTDSDSETNPRLQRKKKYDKLLSASNFQYKKFICFCISCNKMCGDIVGHLSGNHRKMIKHQIHRCHKCLEKFYWHYTLKYHKSFCKRK